LDSRNLLEILLEQAPEVSWCRPTSGPLVLLFGSRSGFDTIELFGDLTPTLCLGRPLSSDPT